MHNLLPSLQEERERQAQLRGAPKIDPNAAAIIIQKVLLSHVTHKVILKNRTVTLDMERVCTKEKDKDSKKQRAFIYWNGKKRSVHASDVGGVNYFTSSQVSTVQPASQKNAAVSLAKKIEVGLLQGVILNATPVHHGFA